MNNIYRLFFLAVAYGLSAVSAQDGENGCVLPAYPPHGTYTADGRPEAVPGQTYDFVSLTVTCDPGHGVVGSNATYCYSRNVWQPMPQCIHCGTSTPRGEPLIYNGERTPRGELPWLQASTTRPSVPTCRSAPVL
ncbi:uncharacterized protein [Choristoneura fumiferana]|uniref:uncharacterized protein n=1 Tax=Choristoneura fumiferana TaxID=7141 RepID=UPI003D159D14